MNESESFSYPLHADRIQLAERELSAFISAVTKLFGPEQAQTSAEDWLEEAELLHNSPLSPNKGWRSVTIAAATRLASKVDAAQHPQNSLTA